MIATGGIDTNGVVFDRPSGQIVSTLSGHSKRVTSIKFVPQDESLVITGSAVKVTPSVSDACRTDLANIPSGVMLYFVFKTVRWWQGSDCGSYDCRHVLKDHTAEDLGFVTHAIYCDDELIVQLSSHFVMILIAELC